MEGNTKQIGKRGEDFATRYLKEKRYKILDRNFKISFGGKIRGEIDIICRKGGVFSFLKQPQTVFVEVKTLKNDNDFLAEDKITFSKRRRMIKTAEIWLSRNGISFDSPWRFDLLVIKIDYFGKKPKVSHLENCFGLKHN